MIRFVLFLLALTPALALAQSPSEPMSLKDPLDYTLDDGIMDQQEMEAEARDMYRLCVINPYQKTYLDCECVAGAFLQQREELGPMVEQSDIYDGILQNKGANCARTENVAGTTYESCMNYATTYREMARDNPEYCTCVANQVALNFKKTPVVNPAYVSRLNYNAMTSCDDPANRPQRSARTNTNQ